MLSVGICVKFLEQDMSLGIIYVPYEPILTLGNLDCQKTFMYCYFPTYKCL